MSATVIEPPASEDERKTRDWQQQVESERQVQELRLMAFFRGEKRDRAAWLTFESMEARHLDVLAWIAGVLRMRTAAAPGAPWFDSEAALYVYLWTAKRDQMGEAPRTQTAEILRYTTRYVWAFGVPSMPEVNS